LEGALRRRVLQLAARAIEQRVNADQSDYAGPHRPCPCGHRTRYAGRRSKRFTTILGDLTLKRAYYHCAACGQGGCPRDRALGLAGTTLSPAVTRMIGAVGALVGFAEGSALLQELAGVTVDPTGVVEAGCKVAIGTRLKRAGMHWTVAGANAIIALRCCRLSGRFEDFWERRAETQRAA
jgi:hypothetical protein